MASDYLPKPDAQLQTWLTNFAAKCGEYDSELGLTSTDLLLIDGQTDTFSDDYNAQFAAKEVLKGLTETKDKSRKAVTATVRSYAKQFKANPAVTPAILGALGITTSSSAGPVVTPTGLTVTGISTGVNKIKWNRAGNSNGTTFIVESSFDGNNFNFVGAVTRTSFSDEGNTPGETQWYRVFATRAGSSSAPCAPVAVYGPGSSGAIHLAA